MAKILPFGDRILVKRRKVGEKLGQDGLIIAPDRTKEADTDIADVLYVPDHSFADRALIEGAKEIIEAQTEKAKAGDCEALKALIEFNHYLKLKSIKPGDVVMIGKYVGVSFNPHKSTEELVLVSSSDIIGKVT